MTDSNELTAKSQTPTANCQELTAKSQMPTAKNQQLTARSQMPTARFATVLVATSVRSAMAERGAFIMRAVLMAVNNAIFFTFWIVLLSRVPSIRGYELGDVAVLYGIVAVAHGLAWFLAGGIQQLARVIHDGELDALIAQPKPTLLS
jgi:ABC-2 type transport system permease protein